MGLIVPSIVGRGYVWKGAVEIERGLEEEKGLLRVYVSNRECEYMDGDGCDCKRGFFLPLFFFWKGNGFGYFGVVFGIYECIFLG